MCCYYTPAVMLQSSSRSGDNMLYPLGANWLLRGLLSKAVFAHITVQQLIDLYKPLHRWTFTTWTFFRFSAFLCVTDP